MDAEQRGPLQRYEVYVSGAHIFAKDGANRSVDIGVIDDDGATLCYRLTLDGLWGDGFLTTEKLLQDVAAKLAYSPVEALFAHLPAPSAELPAQASQSLSVPIEAPGEHPPPGSAAQ